MSISFATCAYRSLTLVCQSRIYITSPSHITIQCWSVSFSHAKSHRKTVIVKCNYYLFITASWRQQIYHFHRIFDFFHILPKVCNNSITEDHTISKTRHYTTLQKNIRKLKVKELWKSIWNWQDYRCELGVLYFLRAHCVKREARSANADLRQRHIIFSMCFIFRNGKNPAIVSWI